MTKLFGFQEGYIVRTMVSMDICEILRVLWEKAWSTNIISTPWKRIIKFEFLELFVEVIGNSFEQCISYRNCCVYHRCSTLRLYSAYLGSSRPTATGQFSADCPAYCLLIFMLRGLLMVSTN